MWSDPAINERKANDRSTSTYLFCTHTIDQETIVDSGNHMKIINYIYELLSLVHANIIHGMGGIFQFFNFSTKCLQSMYSMKRRSLKVQCPALTFYDR